MARCRRAKIFEMGFVPTSNFQVVGTLHEMFCWVNLDQMHAYLTYSHRSEIHPEFNF